MVFTSTAYMIFSLDDWGDLDEYMWIKHGAVYKRAKTEEDHEKAQKAGYSPEWRRGEQRT